MDKQDPRDAPVLPGPSDHQVHSAAEVPLVQPETPALPGQDPPGKEDLMGSKVHKDLSDPGDLPGTTVVGHTFKSNKEFYI